MRELTDLDKVKYAVRYAHVNPCRHGATDDPLRWLWSTHRDVVGAVADPWVSADRLAAALGARRRGFEADFHAFVSMDRQCPGTPFPEAARACTLPAEPLARIARAVLQSTRSEPAALHRAGSDERAVFVQLARRQGWRITPPLADVCRCSRRTIERIASLPPAPGLAAAALCLGDDRLLSGPIVAGRDAFPLGSTVLR